MIYANTFKVATKKHNELISILRKKLKNLAEKVYLHEFLKA